MDSSGTIGLREKTLQGPADNWMRTVGKSPQEDFFFKLSGSLLYFSFLFYLFIVCILGWSSRKRSPSAILGSSPHCPRVIERWAPGALRQVGDRCSGNAGHRSGVKLGG